MKINNLSGALVTVLITLGSPLISQAQWSLVGTPPWTSTSVQTTGGITYFLHRATLQACNAVDVSPVVRSGTNLSFTAAQMAWGGPCVACASCYHTQSTATVLGDLPPGAYRLSIYSYPFYDPLEPPPFPAPSLWQVQDFLVPNQTAPTLDLTSSAHEVLVCLRGVPAAIYVLESSTNLLHWTSIRTNIGGPCTFTNTISDAVAGFFRARVVSGFVNTP